MKNAKLIKLQADFCQAVDCSFCKISEMSGGDCLNYRQSHPKKVVKVLKRWRIDKEIEQAHKKVAELIEEIERKQAKIDDLGTFLSYYREKDKAQQLIQEAEQECKSSDDFKKIAKLKASVRDINYRDYITRTMDGRPCIDVDQLFYESYE